MTDNNQLNNELIIANTALIGAGALLINQLKKEETPKKKKRSR